MLDDEPADAAQAQPAEECFAPRDATGSCGRLLVNSNPIDTSVCHSEAACLRTTNGTYVNVPDLTLQVPTTRDARRKHYRGGVPSPRLPTTSSSTSRGFAKLNNGRRRHILQKWTALMLRCAPPVHACIIDGKEPMTLANRLKGIVIASQGCVQLMAEVTIACSVSKSAACYLDGLCNLQYLTAHLRCLLRTSKDDTMAAYMTRAELFHMAQIRK